MNRNLRILHVYCKIMEIGNWFISLGFATILYRMTFDINNDK